MDRRYFLITALGAVAVGCGGGGSLDPQVPVTPKIRVRWPALGRALDGTPYAMSIRVVLIAAAQTSPPFGGTASVVILANRRSDEAHEALYAATEAIRSGYVRAEVRFYADPNGEGRELLSGTAEVLPDADGLLPDITLKGGSGAPSKLALSLGFQEPTTMAVGESRNLIVNVTWGNSPFGFGPNINAEDYKWIIENSEPAAEPVIEMLPPGVPWPGNTNQLRGLRPGVATLRLRVDGITSEPLSVTVVAAES